MTWGRKVQDAGQAGKVEESPETCAGSRPRRTAATFLGRSLGFWWEVSVRGNLRQGRIIRDPSGVTRNRLKTIGSDDLQVTVCKGRSANDGRQRRIGN
jgi:hypothetical protein